MPPALLAPSQGGLKDDDYKEFYKSLTGDWEDPLFWFHTKAEGKVDYTTLFFIPSRAPLDLHHAEYKGGVKLYVKRVFILDDAKELLPQYLRFVRGIVDSEDLPLNVSREILQQNKVLETSNPQASRRSCLAQEDCYQPARAICEVHWRVQPTVKGRSLWRLRQS